MLPSSGSRSLGTFTGFKAHEFVAHAGKTNCVAVGPRSGQVLATGGDDKVRLVCLCVCEYPGRLLPTESSPAVRPKKAA